jgi:predicted MPP superfamily phosphohydrolase
MRASRLPLAVLAAGFAAGTAGLAYSFAEAHAYALRRFTLPVLPPGSPSLRVLHVSDLHLTPSQHRKATWFAGLAALEPDVVISTGDTIAHRDVVPAALEAHAALFERPGVFALGSNDYYEPRPKNPARYLQTRTHKRVIGKRLPTDDLVKGYLDAGWLDLTNQRGSLTVRGLRLDFVGVDDPHLGYDRYDRVAGQADPDAALTVGVVHAPYRRVLDRMVADGAGLLIAGHTHGGQLCLPVVGALTTNCDLPRSMAKGVSTWHLGGPEAARTPITPAAPLHVSAGIGTSPYTVVRFACRPEASLLTLTARAA